MKINQTLYGWYVLLFGWITCLAFHGVEKLLEIKTKQSEIQIQKYYALLLLPI